MNNKIKRKGFLKPFAVLFMACITTLTLASCDSKADLYSGIDGDSTYVKLGNYSVSNREMFDTFKWSSSSMISNKVNEAITASYLEDVKNTIEAPTTAEQLANFDSYVEGVQEYLIQDVYATETADAVDDINNPYLVAQQKQKFQDTVYQNYNLTLTIAQIEELAAREDGESTLVYSNLNNNQKTVFSKYYDSYAAKLFAKDYLKDEITEYDNEKEDDEDPYYSDSEIKTYWTNNYEYKYDLKAILIRFISADEVNQVLKTFGLKVYRSHLYFIKQTDVERPNQEATNLTNDEYSKWYDDFDFASAANSLNAIDLTRHTPTLMLSLYVEMYNYVYSYREPLNNIDLPSDIAFDTSNRRTITSALIDQFMTNEDISEMTYDDFYNEYLSTSDYINYNGERLDEINTSLKSYMYTTLDLNKADANYSTAGQNYSDYYFMAFKISDAVVPDSDKLYFTDEDEEEIDRTQNTALIDTIIDELMEEELTSTYISNAIADKAADCKVKIYDNSIEIAYMASNSGYSKTRKSSPGDGILARVTYEDTTIDLTALDVWNELEPANGISVAVDILSRKVIKDSSEFAKIKADKELTDGYYDTLNVLLANFASGQLASYGYDSSLGKYNFLMLYFHTADMEEIIDNYYRLSAASNEMLNDFSSESLAELLQTASVSYFDQYFSLSATNLLVYIDMDEDGSPDKYFDWNQKIAKPFDGITTYGELAQALINDIITIIDNSTESDVDTMASIVSEYKSSSRFGNGYNDQISSDGSYDPTEPEKYWAKYRVNGLLISSSELASITNSSDYTAIYDVLKIAMFDAFTESSYLFEDETVPAEYLVTKYYEGSNNGLVSVDGYNLFTLTSATINEDATFTQDDDLNEIYKDLVYIYNDEAYKVSDLYSDTKYLSINQVRAYLMEYATSQTTASLPTSVATALTTYLKPIYDRFTSETSQFSVLVSYLIASSGSTGFEYGNSDLITLNQERFDKIIEINHRVQDNYVVTDYSQVYDDSVNLTFFNSTDGQAAIDKLQELGNLYGNWWSELASYASSAFVKGE